MKYHYKSPEQLRQELAVSRPAKRRMRFFNSKTSMIIFLDIMGLVLIGGILYYNGFLSSKSQASKNTETYGSIELSAGIVGATRTEARLLLNIKNTGDSLFAFPPASFESLRAEIRQSDAVSFSQKLMAKNLEIRPHQTASMELSVPFSQELTHFTATIYLVFKDRIIRLEIPVIQTEDKAEAEFARER